MRLEATSVPLSGTPRRPTISAIIGLMHRSKVCSSASAVSQLQRDLASYSSSIDTPVQRKVAELMANEDRATREPHRTSRRPLRCVLEPMCGSSPRIFARAERPRRLPARHWQAVPRGRLHRGIAPSPVSRPRLRQTRSSCLRRGHSPPLRRFGRGLQAPSFRDGDCPSSPTRH